jgi:predicted alpha/beta-hydrolase family hydrolase
MGVYLCIGQPIWKANIKTAMGFDQFGTFDAVHRYSKNHPVTLVFLGHGIHKIKKKSEQLACEHALSQGI